MSSDAPLVSIVIPVFNAEAYVAECVRSALRQSYDRTEIICVDDGSTDGTREILQELEASHPDEIELLLAEHEGAPAARNKGLRRAEGEYIQFFDADDLLHPEKIAHQVALVRQDRPDLVAGSYRQEVFSEEAVPKDSETVHVEDDAWRGLLRGANLGITSSNLWRRAFVEEIGGWNEALDRCQDAELMFRMLRHGAQVTLDRTVHTTVRRRDDSVWNADVRASRKRWLELRVQMIHYLQREGMLTDDRREAIYPTAFLFLHELYDTDPAFTIAVHNEIFRDSYTPPFSRGYRLMYRLFGFRGAEVFRSTWKNVRGAVGNFIS